MGEPVAAKPVLVCQYVGTVRSVASRGSLLAWGIYLDRFADEFAMRPLEDVRPSEVMEFVARVRQDALRRKGNRDGKSAEEHAITAVRKLYTVAMVDGIVGSNPALRVPKPRREPSKRHGLSHAQVADLFRVASDRDTAVLRFMLETACRREGVVNLSPRGLRVSRQTVVLDEKFARTREQPISAAMCELLADEGCDLYRVTRRRLDGLWGRLRGRLDWAEDLGVSSHWLRHTTASWVETACGYSVAGEFLGHAAVGTTATYTRRGLTDVARAFSTVFGEPHPLA